VAAALLLEEMTYGGLVRLLLAPRTETGKPKGPGHTMRREMLALKLILMVAGALMLLVAAAIPLVGVWRRVQLARNKAVAEGTVEKMEAETRNRKRFPGGVRLRSRWLAACRCWWRPACGGAQRHGRCAHQPMRGTLPGTLYLECTS